LRREPLKILRQFSRKKLVAANKNFGPPLLNRQKPIQLRSKLTAKKPRNKVVGTFFCFVASLLCCSTRLTLPPAAQKTAA
jgi:hypothetical protein